jgi:hypothetical protein
MKVFMLGELFEEDWSLPLALYTAQSEGPMVL